MVGGCIYTSTTYKYPIFNLANWSLSTILLAHNLILYNFFLFKRRASALYIIDIGMYKC